MPQDKVILPREVAETLDSFIGGGMTSEEILRRALNGECEDLAYFTDRIDDLMRALVVGYEVEKTCFDKLKELYWQAASDSMSAGTLEYSRFNDGIVNGIYMTLEILAEKYPELNELRKELAD